MASRWMVLFVTLAGCLTSSSTTCDDRVCPTGTQCALVTNPDQELCVTPDQLTACANLPSLAECMAQNIPTGRCYDGVCLAAGCGNSRVDPDEVCDDGNAEIGDGCSYTCLSLEVCGNGHLDPVALVNDLPVARETCDDGNLYAHDGCSSDCVIEEPQWLEIDPQAPPSVEGAAMVYDSARARVVMVGGTYTNSFTGETVFFRNLWEWDGTTWVRPAVTTSPPPRTHAALAYDSVRHRVVLYGGMGISGVLGDIWEWDGTQWTNPPAGSPPIRSGHAMAFDPVRKKVLMFGGRGNGGGTADSDVWEWDGKAWAKQMLATTPTPRSDHAMAYDPARGVMVVAGGTTQDTWELSSAGWSQRAGSQATPPALGLASMAWDAVTRRMVTYGGQGQVAEMWSWDGTTWSSIAQTDPADRYGVGLASDAARGQVILYGGHHDNIACGTCPSQLGDTWRWNGSAWSDATPTQTNPPPLHSHAAAYDSVHGRMVIATGESAVVGTPAGDTFIYDHGIWRQPTGAAITARYNSVMAYDAARDRTVLFGGRDAGGLLGDTWLFDGNSWTQPTMPVPSPSPRESSAMAYDPIVKRVVLYGGSSTSDRTTWEWDGTSWALRSATSLPQILAKPVMTFDPSRARVVMFDTSAADGSNLMWEWDSAGGAWKTIYPLQVPAQRGFAAAAWNGARQSFVMTGGNASSEGTSPLYLDDSWEEHEDAWRLITSSSSPPARDSLTMTAARDGASVLVFGGKTGGSVFGTLWQLRWSGSHSYEACATTVDLDGDGVGGCDDSDCWSSCAPLCPPGSVQCDPTWPHCGDGVCNADLESCRLCPGDCGACPARCGDDFCDAGETNASCPGDCP